MKRLGFETTGLLCGLILGVSAFLDGCGSDIADNLRKMVTETSDRESEQTVVENSTEAEEQPSGTETETLEETGKCERVEGLYDRTYLKESNGTFTYRMDDLSVTAEYEQLYLEAFEDVIVSNQEVTGWMLQDYTTGQATTTSNLLYTDGNADSMTKTGSYYEMDYNFDLKNVGYNYVDLNSDGIFELIFGVLDNTSLEWIPYDCFERAYTLVNGHAVKICEGGSRDLHWLGNDGYIYESGSGGAAYCGIWKLRFAPERLKVNEELNWGSDGFIKEGYLGCWEVPVHIEGTFEDIDSAAKLPENRITDAEFGVLNEEWEARKVKIEWLRMADYMDEHYPEGM